MSSPPQHKKSQVSFENLTLANQQANNLSLQLTATIKKYVCSYIHTYVFSLMFPIVPYLIDASSRKLHMYVALRLSTSPDESEE